MEGKRISQLTPDTSPSTDDYIVTVDGSTTQNKRVDLGRLPVSTAQATAIGAKVNKAGDTMTGRLVTPSTEINGVLYLTGLGFPSGVVSAPVGSIYIDKNITNGASSWIKKSGTGNTGWQVLEGDTGWRNIASTLINGWTVSLIRIRRVGNEVNILIEGLSAASSTNASCIPIPSGFGVFAITSARQLLHTAAIPAAVYRTAAEFGNLAVSGATTSTPTLYGGNLYLTNDAWPTTLPGTAA